MSILKNIVTGITGPKTNLYSVFGVFYVISKLYGHLMFTVPSDVSTPKVTMTYKDKLWFCVVSFMNLIQIWITFTEYVHDYRERGATLYDIGNIVIVVFGVILTFILTWLNLIYQNPYWTMFRTLHDIDQRLINLDVKLNYQYQHKQMVCYIFIKHVLFLIAAGLEEWSNSQNNKTNYKYSFIKNYAYGTIDMFLGTFIIVTEMICYRLKCLNKTIKLYFNLDTDVAIIAVSSNKSNIDWVFTEFSVIYSKIVKLSVMNTQITSIKILLSLFAFFIYTLLATFAIYYMINLDLKMSDMLIVISHLYWNLLYLTQVIHIIIVGSSFLQQARLTTSLMYSAMNRYSDEKIMGKMLLLSLQTTHKLPEISCKLFVIDWKVILAIGSSLASYLVILIQVQGEVTPK